MSDIFVFGSNLAGRHGSGAALYARQNYGAVYGVGVGPTGLAYALPTCGCQIETLPLEVIRLYADQFIEYAEAMNHLTFQVTRVGCGLAGYTNDQIAPMFVNAPANCWFDSEWDGILNG